MKTQLIILSTVLGYISLMVFGIMEIDKTSMTPPTVCKANIAEPTHADPEYFADFVYDYGPRFIPVTKSELNKARSFADFISEENLRLVDSYDNVTIILLENNEKTNIRETSYSGKLNKKQLKLLKAADYSDHFRVDAMYFRRNKEYQKNEYDYMVPFRTVVPETQATYSLGKDAFLAYLESNNKENTINLEKDRLRPGQVNFTITKDGQIKNIALTNTSGYKVIDQNIMKLIKETPGKWSPAENAKGEKIAQTYMVSFGIAGC